MDDVTLLQFHIHLAGNAQNNEINQPAQRIKQSILM